MGNVGTSLFGDWPLLGIKSQDISASTVSILATLEWKTRRPHDSCRSVEFFGQGVLQNQKHTCTCSSTLLDHMSGPATVSTHWQPCIAKRSLPLVIVNGTWAIWFSRHCNQQCVMRDNKPASFLCNFSHTNVVLTLVISPEKQKLYHIHSPDHSDYSIMITCLNGASDDDVMGVVKWHDAPEFHC